MNLTQRVSAFVRLSKHLKENLQAGNYDSVFQKAYYENGWFTKEYVTKALESIIDHYLSEEELIEWISRYDLNKVKEPRRVAIIMAGNIPFVGFHDLLSVLISGHSAMIKFSAKDSVLPQWIIKE